MSPAITPSPVCAKTYSTASKPVEKVAHPDNGAQERLRCLPHNTSKRVADTNRESSSTQSEKLDKAKMAYQEWQAIYTRTESYRGALPTGESYQGSFIARVCRYYESQAEGESRRQTICKTA
jgi:hypothetical protein